MGHRNHRGMNMQVIQKDATGPRRAILLPKLHATRLADEHNL